MKLRDLLENVDCETEVMIKDWRATTTYRYQSPIVALNDTTRNFGNRDIHYISAIDNNVLYVSLKED